MCIIAHAFHSIRSGCLDVRRMMDMGMKVGLGTGKSPSDPQNMSVKNLLTNVCLSIGFVPL